VYLYARRMIVQISYDCILVKDVLVGSLTRQRGLVLVVALSLPV